MVCSIGYKAKHTTPALALVLCTLLLAFTYPHSTPNNSYGISGQQNITDLFPGVQVYLLNQTYLELNFTNATNDTSVLNYISNYTNTSDLTHTNNLAPSLENADNESLRAQFYRFRYFTIDVNTSTQNGYVGNTIKLSAIIPPNVLNISSFIQYKWIVADGSSCPGFNQRGFGDSSNVLNYTPSGSSSNCIFGVFALAHLDGWHQGYNWNNGNGQQTSWNCDDGNCYNLLIGYGESNAINIQNETKPLNVNGISVSSNPIDFNQQITLKTTVSGGMPAYNGMLFAAYNSTASNAFVLVNSSCLTSGSTISCKFANTNSTRRSGSFYFKIMVSDSSGNAINTSISNAVKIESLSIFPNKATINSGGSVVFTNKTGPGSDTYVNFTYIISPSNGFVENGNNFTFDEPGNYSVMLMAQGKTQDSSPPANETVEANAIITVVPSLTFGAPNITIPNSTIDVGQSEQITANVIGGTGPYTYIWTDNGNTLTGTTNTITFTGSYPGINDISVKVTDSQGETANGLGTVTVNNALTFGAPNITIPNSTIDVGQSEQITANVIGGTGPYTYIWTDNGNTLTGTTNTITFTGSYPGINDISVKVTDSQGETANGLGTVTVNNALISISPQLVKVDLGQKVAFSSFVSNSLIIRIKGFNWEFTPNGSANSLLVCKNTFNCTFSPESSGNVMLFVDLGNITFNSTNSIVTVVGNALNISVSPLFTSIYTGASTTFTASVSGGSGDFAYQWYNTTNGVALIPGATTNTLTVQGDATGNFTYHVNVTDLETNPINTAESNLASLEVETQPQSNGGGSSGGGGGSGGGSGGGGGGGGGGNFMPSVSKINDCVSISNFTQLNDVSFILDNKSFNIVENFITPTSAGITINGVKYTITPGSKTTVINSGNYTLELGSISYVPIIQTITVSICGSASNPPTTTVPPSNSTKTNPPSNKGTGANKGTGGTSNGGGDFFVTIHPKSINAKPGELITLIANVTGGFGNYTYTWYNDTSGNPVEIPGQKNKTLILVAGNFTGTDKYSVMVSNALYNARALSNLTYIISNISDKAPHLSAQPPVNKSNTEEDTILPSIMAIVLVSMEAVVLNAFRRLYK